jgi:hypothetical protein
VTLPNDPALLAVHDQRTRDNEHLKLIAIFNYVMGGLTALTSCFAIIHIILGIGMIAGMSAADAGAGALVGYIFLAAGLAVLLLGWGMGGLMVYSGRMIQRRQKRTFSMVMAGLQCLSFPVGTALGVWSLIVLNRPSVKSIYNGQPDATVANPFGAGADPHALPSSPASTHIPDEGESEVWKNLDKLAAGDEKTDAQSANEPENQKDHSA